MRNLNFIRRKWMCLFLSTISTFLLYFPAQSQEPAHSETLSPAKDTRFFFQPGATGIAIPLVNNGEFYEPKWLLDNILIAQVSGAFPQIPDITALEQKKTHWIQQIIQQDGHTFYYPPVSLRVFPMDGDKDNDGFPNVTNLLTMRTGDQWRASIRDQSGNPIREVAITPLDAHQDSCLWLCVPGYSSHCIRIQASHHLLKENESAVVIAVVEKCTSPPHLPGFPGKVYPFCIFVAVEMTNYWNSTLSPLSDDRLRAYPVSVALLPAPKDILFLHGACSYTSMRHSKSQDALLSGIDWKYTVLDKHPIQPDRVSARISHCGVILAVSSPNSPRIVKIWNPSTHAASGFASGGEKIIIETIHTTAGLDWQFTIDGNEAPVEQQSPHNNFTRWQVQLPRAQTVPAPAREKQVSVSLHSPKSPGNRYTLYHAFTYTGPMIETVEKSPDIPSLLTITGQGFDPSGMTARWDNRPILPVQTPSRAIFRGEMPSDHLNSTEQEHLLQLFTSNGFFTSKVIPPARASHKTVPPSESLDEKIHVDSITPQQGWIFGGTIVHLTGDNFIPVSGHLPEVRFGGLPASYPPPDAGFPQNTHTLNIIPPIFPAEPGTQKSYTVDIEIQNEAGQGIRIPKAFTYIQQEAHREVIPKGIPGHPIAEGMVYSFAFVPPAKTGSHYILPTPDGDVSLTFPPLNNTVFLIIRLTQTPELFQGTAIPWGHPVPHAWYGDIHLYDSRYPFEEIFPRFPLDEMNTCILQVPWESETPVGPHTGLAWCGVKTTVPLQFPLGLPVPNIGPNGEKEFSLYWQTGPSDTVITGNSNKTQQRLQGYLLHTGSFCIRRDVDTISILLPDNQPALAAQSAIRGPYTGGTPVIITGRGLAWPQEIRFGNITVYSARHPSKALVYSRDTELCVLSPRINPVSTATPVAITLVLGYGEKKKECRLEESFVYRSPSTGESPGSLMWKTLQAILQPTAFQQ